MANRETTSKKRDEQPDIRIKPQIPRKSENACVDGIRFVDLHDS